MKHKIVQIFQEETDVAAVYLYGSRAVQKERPDSDIDLAVLFNNKMSKVDSFNKLQDIYVKLSRAVSKEFDLIDLEQVNLILLYEVFKNGEILFERDRDKNRQFRARKIVEYLDFSYNLEMCVEGMRKKTMEKYNSETSSTD